VLEISAASRRRQADTRSDNHKHFQTTSRRPQANTRGDNHKHFQMKVQKLSLAADGGCRGVSPKILDPDVVQDRHKTLRGARRKQRRLKEHGSRW